MSLQIMVPDLPESVSDATVGTWHKKLGDIIKAGELLVDLETDKVVLEVPAPQDGIVSNILFETGSTVQAKQLLAELQPAPASGEETKAKPAEAVADAGNSHDILTPSVRRILAEEEVDPANLHGSGRGGRITRQDVLEHLSRQESEQTTVGDIAAVEAVDSSFSSREEKRVPMTRLRKRIAERLLEAKNTTAMLTTFNEVNMQPIMKIRSKYQEQFEKRHGIKLGFMSFYVKAVSEALKRYPEVNASIDGNDILYHNYFDISIAVSTERGLVTPVLRNCDELSLADIEKGIKSLADKARDGKLSVDDLTGGTFTITNGGVFGSLMSTPIINPPQSAILGMHKIQDRPMAVDGQVVILPMMYLALSYDHRIIDGRESVGFLVHVKSLLEDPTRLLLDI
ncbi:2-oxoglutarate dehydrogenase complex dihydrolipoyllysine-residue succinyltransferase [Tolumonas lignilytica]|uniref:2-oxoglutarate dehydrogenase complex dihydrolipoyllysine-residue succinyltransferase n=1 Tax=Tolumonas lignilytica TaxID=1283284 RepID=UPI000465D2D2|nr:2-oxoglutarate dehydrogenase complex dihydrolipoyllysine-residue succinyltransferase [Tolumonas lignilytica]